MLLELINVSKYYDLSGEAGTPPVLKDISLQVAAGESVAITGPSGSGKSTLLNIIGALDRPTDGRVLLEGSDLARLDDKELSMIRNRQIGFVFQLHHLLPQYTVLENVLIPTLASSENRPSREESEAMALRLLERVGLTHRLSYRPGKLSGGERQRAAVVRALINQPKLLLADEPTGSLDRTSAENLVQLLLEINREEGVTLIMVTHSQGLGALMSRTLELANGTLIPKDVGSPTTRKKKEGQP